MELAGVLMVVYEVLGAVGGILQIVLLLLRRKSSILLALGLLLDTIGLSGLSCWRAVTEQPLFAIGDLVIMSMDVAFILYILYREEHPKKKK